MLLPDALGAFQWRSITQIDAPILTVADDRVPLWRTGGSINAGYPKIHLRVRRMPYVPPAVTRGNYGL